MTLFELVKQTVSVRDAAEYYGLQVNRSRMCRCPFHDDLHPSMKLNQACFYCFSCEATGDVIDLVARLFGLNPDQVEYAAEMAMEHHLGLTCDPICGLVQIPCIERNAVAAMRAMNACNLSYFLCGTRNISYDMVCKAMYETGLNLSHQYKETSEGGLAHFYNRRRRR